LRTRCVVIARRTHLLGALELVVGGEGDGEEVLVRVDKGVDDRGDGGDADGEGDGGDGADARGELGEEGALLNVEDRRGEDGAVVVDLDDGHTVGEGRDVEHVEQRRLGGTDLVAGRHDLDVVDDLDGTTRDLGRDTERLEEGRLSGLHAGVAGRDEHVVGRDGAGTGRGGDLVRDDDLADVLEVTGREDEADVALDEREDLLELGELAEEATDGAAHHRVLAHEDDTLAAERHTDHVQLLRRDVVDVDDEDGGCGVSNDAIKTKTLSTRLHSPTPRLQPISSIPRSFPYSVESTTLQPRLTPPSPLTQHHSHSQTAAAPTHGTAQGEP
jgi:hypothetical protein